MSGKQKRRTFSGQDKVAIVKRHLIDGVPVFLKDVARVVDDMHEGKLANRRRPEPIG